MPTLRVLPGRRLIPSPEWDGGGPSLLFDACSGDFWVVTPLARHLILTVATAQSVQDTAISLPGHENPELASVIHELVRQGILAQT